jgi:hypothetical protein
MCCHIPISRGVPPICRTILIGLLILWSLCFLMPDYLSPGDLYSSGGFSQTLHLRQFLLALVHAHIHIKIFHHLHNKPQAFEEAVDAHSQHSIRASSVRDTKYSLAIAHGIPIHMTLGRCDDFEGPVHERAQLFVNT